MIGPGTRVALIGDSHMEALGPRLRQLLPAQLGAIVVRVEPRRGWSTKRYRQTGAVSALAAGADVVVIELGGNDASVGIGPTEHARDVSALVRAAAPAKVIWVGPGVTLRPDLEAYRAPIREVQRQVVPALGGAWIDGQSLTRAQDLRSDRVHYTAPGYERWATALVPLLARAQPGETLSDSVWPWLGPVLVGSTAAAVLGVWWASRR